MLTINQIVKLYEDGFEINVKRKPHPAGFKGEYDPATLEAAIYEPALESAFDRDLTILHEAIHCRNAVIWVPRNGRYNNRSIEREARKTYTKRPYVLEFLKQLYGIK